jgi:predicted lipase
MMITVCGTTQNWVDDINTIKQNYTWCSGCEVHKGFYNTYLSVQGQIQDAFFLLHKAYPSAPLQVTGHSLGAAVAVHCALDMIQSFGVYPEPVYDFGQPRVGNENFQQYYTNMVKTAWRLTHHKDPVPHLPFESWGFHQNPVEIFYNQKQTSYKVCNESGEDKLCSDRYLLDLNVLDRMYRASRWQRDRARV